MPQRRLGPGVHLRRRNAAAGALERSAALQAGAGRAALTTPGDVTLVLPLICSDGPAAEQTVWAQPDGQEWKPNNRFLNASAFCSHTEHLSV